MSMAQSEWAIGLHFCATYAFGRESRRKTRENHWTNDRQELINNNIVYNFLEDNIARIFNLRESKSVRGEAVPPALGLASGNIRGIPGHSYVCDFNGNEKLTSIEEVCRAKQKHVFERGAEKIAGWFLERPSWPKQYLFVCQWQIKNKQNANEQFEGLAILTTKLARDSLAEDANKIIIQLKTGTLERRVQKGILYPHMTDKNGKVSSESKVKVFEQRSALANYFYDFLNLNPPESPQKLTESAYEEMSKRGSSSLEELGHRVGVENSRETRVKIGIDGFDISSSLDELNKKLRLARIGNRYYLLIQGSTVKIELGSVDALKKGGVQSLSKQELINHIAKVQ